MESLWSLVTKGGILMVPIGLCSIIALAVAVERSLVLRAAVLLPEAFLAELRGALRRGKVEEVLDLCRRSSLAIARIAEAGVHRAGLDRRDIREAMEVAGRHETEPLFWSIGALSTIASISPLLGLLGTVKGLIQVFHEISLKGVGDPLVLSGGISEALLTTAAGLVVGIPTLVLYHAFVHRAQRLRQAYEKTALSLLDDIVSLGERGQ